MTQSNDLSQTVDRTEGQIVDLQLTANLILQAIGKNSGKGRPYLVWKERGRSRFILRYELVK